MANYLKRLIYVDATETRRINPLYYPFLFATLIYGLGFALFGWWSGVSISSLYTALSTIHPWLPTIWGAAALAAGGSALLLLLTRTGPWGEYASMLGVMVWLFASLIYLFNGFWLVIFTVAIPNGFFWVYYYWVVKRYQRLKHAGLLQDP